jgi:hypothetical protein
MRIRVHPDPILACHQTWIMQESRQMMISGFLTRDEFQELMLLNAASKLKGPFASILRPLPFLTSIT